MKILLLRHGIAVERGKLADELRYLTPQGRKELELYFPYLAFSLRDKAVTLWSSPLIRACETARILTKYLKPEDFELKEFLADGRADALREAVDQWVESNKTATTSSEAEPVLVLCGHEPFLSAWIYAWISCKVKMGKGSACLLDLNSNGPNDASLEYCKQITDFPSFFLPAEALIRLKPLDSVNVELQLPALIEASLETVTARRNDFLAKPDEVETCHQLRVSLRRFRALISLIKKAVPAARYLRIQDELRALTQESAVLREIDVLQELLEEACREQEIQIQEAQAKELLAWLRTLRREHADALYEVVRSNTWIQRLYEAYYLLLDRFDPEIFRSVGAASVLQERLQHWQIQMYGSLLCADELTMSTVHPPRLKAKKIRYNCEIFSSFFEPNLIDSGRLAKRLQNRLGTVCDCLRNPLIWDDLIAQMDPEARKELEDAIASFRQYLSGCLEESATLLNAETLCEDTEPDLPVADLPSGEIVSNEVHEDLRDTDLLDEPQAVSELVLQSDISEESPESTSRETQRLSRRFLLAARDLWRKICALLRIKD